MTPSPVPSRPTTPLPASALRTRARAAGPGGTVPERHVPILRWESSQWEAVCAIEPAGGVRRRRRVGRRRRRGASAGWRPRRETPRSLR